MGIVSLLTYKFNDDRI